MEEMIMRKQTFMANSNPSPLSIHRDSRSITKAKPKIRIIHIFAPEIIKTDVANFRELVQRLTGKPASLNPDNRLVKPAGSTGKRRHRRAPLKLVVGNPADGSMPLVNLHKKPPLMITRKMEPFNGFIGSASHHDDYFSGFSDIDHFIHDISELPLLPMDPSHHIHSSF